MMGVADGIAWALCALAIAAAVTAESAANATYQALLSGTGLSGIFGALLAPVIGTSLLSAAWVGWVIAACWGVVGAILLYCAIKEWRKWGAKRGGFAAAIIVLALISVFALWNVWAVWF